MSSIKHLGKMDTSRIPLIKKKLIEAGFYTEIREGRLYIYSPNMEKDKKKVLKILRPFRIPLKEKVDFT
jgi:hypothetical protein